MFGERKSAISMSFRRKWQETDTESALDEVKRGAVSNRDAGDQHRIPGSSIRSKKKEKVWKNLPSRFQREDFFFFFWQSVA